jgi:hypothetical protein
VYVLRRPQIVDGEAHVDIQTNKNILGGRCRRAGCVLSAQNFIESLLSSSSDGTPKPEDSVDENGIRTTVEYVINDEGKKVKVCLVQFRSSTSTIFCLHFVGIIKPPSRQNRSPSTVLPHLPPSCSPIFDLTSPKNIQLTDVSPPTGHPPYPPRPAKISRRPRSRRTTKVG